MPLLAAPVVVGFPDEGAAYAAREAIVAVPTFAVASTPKWQACDHAAIYVGHAANYAALVDKDPAGEHDWQRQRLIDLILSWDVDEWKQAQSQNTLSRKRHN